MLPVLWDDNYVTLLPGETRELEAAYAPKDLGSATPVVTVDGWNVGDAAGAETADSSGDGKTTPSE